jgi:hypothetical protein
MRILELQAQIEQLAAQKKLLEEAKAKLEEAVCIPRYCWISVQAVAGSAKAWARLKSAQPSEIELTYFIGVIDHGFTTK